MTKDPEVLADLAKRQESELDRKRNSDGDYGKQIRELLDDPIVDRWRCRQRGCEALVDVPRSASDSLSMFNAQLERRRQPAIRTDEVLFCDACKARLKQDAAEAKRLRSENISSLVKLLSRSAQPEREHAMIRQLKQWDHPDVDGLVAALAAKRRRSGGMGSI